MVASLVNKIKQKVWNSNILLSKLCGKMLYSKLKKCMYTKQYEIKILTSGRRLFYNALIPQSFFKLQVRKQREAFN